MAADVTVVGMVITAVMAATGAVLGEAMVGAARSSLAVYMAGRTMPEVMPQAAALFIATTGLVSFGHAGSALLPFE
jgi:hypothetical protein